MHRFRVVGYVPNTNQERNRVRPPDGDYALKAGLPKAPAEGQGQIGERFAAHFRNMRVGIAERDTHQPQPVTSA